MQNEYVLGYVLGYLAIGLLIGTIQDIFRVEPTDEEEDGEEDEGVSRLDYYIFSILLWPVYVVKWIGFVLSGVILAIPMRFVDWIRNNRS